VGLRPCTNTDELWGKFLQECMGVKVAFDFGKSIHHIPQRRDTRIANRNRMAVSRLEVSIDVGGSDSTSSENRNRDRRSVVGCLSKRDPAQFLLCSR